MRAVSVVKPPERVRRRESRVAPVPRASPMSLAIALMYVPLLQAMRMSA